MSMQSILKKPKNGKHLLSILWSKIMYTMRKLDQRRRPRNLSS